MKVEYNPRVSIVIPVYNGSNYLREAIDSALSQKYRNIEVIVVDDGSTDNTGEIAESYGHKIRYFAKANGGVASAMNLGLEKMSGDYFSWLSHDDAYYPEKIDQQIKYLSKQVNKNIILYSDYTEMDSDSKTIREVKLNHKMLMKKPEYGLMRGLLNGNTILVPRGAFEKYGRFKENLKCSQDYDKWYDMMKTYKFVHLSMLLAKYRIHPGQDTKKNPVAASEGDATWLRMIKEFPDEAKIRLEGNIYHFYKELAVFLKGTPYKNATEYAEKKAEEALSNKNKFSASFAKISSILRSSVLREKIWFAFFSPKQFLRKYFHILIGG